MGGSNRTGREYKGKWLVWGGFNKVLFSHECWGQRAYHDASLTEFRSLIARAMLQEMDYVGEPYTWYKSRQGDHSCMSKINYVFTSQGLRDAWLVQFYEVFQGGRAIIPT